MPNPAPEPVKFDQKHAASYDTKFAAMAPMREVLHFLTRAILAEIPDDARVLCVGAGTGLELMDLARAFPRWRFTAVEPSAPMLDICRQKVADHGLSPRCEFHEGYLDSLPPAGPFDAATCLLVSHFITPPDERRAFFRRIADRLQPDGVLVTADLASDTTAPAYESLLKVWLRLMRSCEVTAEEVEKMRAAYGRDVAIAPPGEVGSLLASAGFGSPVLFLQTLLIHGWYARRTS